MLTDERPDVFERLSALGDHLDAEREAFGSPTPRAVARRIARRSRVPLVAATIVTVVGLAAIAGLDRSEPADQPASSTPQATSEAADPAPSPAEPADESTSSSAPARPFPADEIVWQRATDLGSLARSQVVAVVAGPTGFVAIGMGFDDAQNQGRVWHSPDGLAWEEPALDLFDPKTVEGLAATDDAYFVLAGTNPDRLGLGEAAVSPDRQLFRSTDGRNWEPWGGPWGESGGVASTGEVLLRRSPPPGPVEWSIDGQDWTAATFSDGPVGDAFFDVSTGGVVQADGITYLRGFAGTKSTVWSSSNGREWDRLPTPPAGGTVASVPGGIVVITNPRQQECAGGGDSNVQWSCTAQPDVYRYDGETGVWTLASSRPGDTPVTPWIARLNNTLVAPLTESDKAMTVWTARADSLEWEQQPATRLEYIDNTGSPGMATISTSQDRVVVITDDRLVDDETAILVGRIRPSSD